LTDCQGRTVDFRNSVVIMTSNLGSELWLNGQSGMGKEQAHQVLQAHFRPEFLNRIQKQIIFYPLEFKAVLRIIDKNLHNLNQMLSGKEIRVVLTAAARQFLAASGYSEKYGAREIRRTFEKYLAGPLSKRLLEEDVKAGDVIEVDYDGKTVVLNKLSR
jgi:ATP-dependent Clp protease ATP-binding subunit ClpB